MRREVGLLLVLAVAAIPGCGDRELLAPADPGQPAFPPALTGAPELAAAVATNVWTTKAAMPAVRTGLAVGVVNGVLYAIGGANGVNYLTTNQAYTAGSNSWTAKAPLPQPRHLLNGTGVINGVLYVAGGINTAGQPTATLYAYTASSNSWATRAAMGAPGACGASGVIGGKLYVYSGCWTPSFQRYDPATNQWVARKLPAALHVYPAAGVLGGKFFLVGGNGEDGFATATVEAYDPATDTWTARAPVQLPRSLHTAAVSKGLLYVTGGGDARTEVYDPATNVWRIKPAIPTARLGLASGVVNNQIYAVGGSNGGDLPRDHRGVCARRCMGDPEADANRAVCGGHRRAGRQAVRRRRLHRQRKFPDQRSVRLRRQHLEHPRSLAGRAVVRFGGRLERSALRGGRDGRRRPADDDPLCVQSLHQRLDDQAPDAGGWQVRSRRGHGRATVRLHRLH